MTRFTKWFKSLMPETEKKIEYQIPFGEKVSHPYYFVKINDYVYDLWEFIDDSWVKTGGLEGTQTTTNIKKTNKISDDTLKILKGKLTNIRLTTQYGLQVCDIYDRITEKLQKEIDTKQISNNAAISEDEIKAKSLEAMIEILDSDVVDTNKFRQISGINIANENNTQDDNIRQVKNLFVEGTFANDKEKTSTDMFIGVDSDVVKLAKKSNISTDKYADLELPQKFESDLLDTLVTAYFYRKNLSTATSAVWFTVYGDKPELLEYTGKIEPIKKLINNPEYFSRLLMTRRDYYQYLIVTKGAGQNTMTIAFLDDDGVCLGFLALWHNKEKFPVFDENLKKDLTVFSEIA